MNYFFKLICACTLICLPLLASAQQRPVISQYMFNPLALNPAYAGSTGMFSATALHRSQWVNIEGAPSIQTASLHTSLRNRPVGVGAQVWRDQVGIHVDHGVYGMYSYRIRMSHGNLALGLQGGFNNRVSDFNLLHLKHPDDPLLNDRVSRFTANFGTGLYYYNNQMFVGLSVPYMLTNKIFNVPDEISTAREKRYYYLHGGLVVDLSEKFKFRPSALVRMQENQPFAIDLNAMAILDNVLMAGLSYRYGDAFIVLTELQFTPQLRFGYAYDLVSSGQNPFTRGSHEFMLNYRFEIKNHKKDPHCPSYF